MFGSKATIGVGCCALALGLALGCGGATEHGNDSGTSGSVSEGGSVPGHGGSSTGGAIIGRAGMPSSGGSMMDGGPIMRDPVDSGCPTQDLPPPQLACDPFTPGSCGPGAGCYPFVDHPQGSGCDEQKYGTECLPPGQGKQGDLCGEGAGDYCAPGFVCVVGQRAGKRCASLCQLGSVDQCSGGLVCGDLDVPGFGVCG